MILEPDIAPLKRLSAIPPEQIQRQAESLRDRSRKCAELASDCLTDDAKLVLESMAKDLGKEADELEGMLIKIRRLYAETFAAN